MRFKLSDIIKASGGKLLCGDENAVVTSFCTDSREAEAGAMFIPLIGEKVDSHIYIGSVFEKGACASFTQRPVTYADGAAVLVEDCRKALQDTAAWYRGLFDIPIVGITGSVGKTTTKEMVAQALSAGHNVMKTVGNRNSQIGVPVTVCTLEKEHTAAVVEMGVSMPGEMERIARVVKPTCAVMTNIGISHIEYLKTRENIMEEKLRIADYLPENGMLFVNGDDELLSSLKGRFPEKVRTFGISPECDYRASEIDQTDEGTHFLCSPGSGHSARIFVPAMGLHNVRNALVSMAVAMAHGVPFEDAAGAIAAYKPPAMRQEIFEAHGLTVIDDSYNASPDSVKSALDILSLRTEPGRKVAVLADMLELGDHAVSAHRETGRYAYEKGISALIGIGELSRETVSGFGGEGHWFENNADAIEFLKAFLAPGDAVLIKGSRGMKTDEIAKALKQGLV